MGIKYTVPEITMLTGLLALFLTQCNAPMGHDRSVYMLENPEPNSEAILTLDAEIGFAETYRNKSFFLRKEDPNFIQLVFRRKGEMSFEHNLRISSRPKDQNSVWNFGSTRCSLLDNAMTCVLINDGSWTRTEYFPDGSIKSIEFSNLTDSHLNGKYVYYSGKPFNFR